MNRIVKKYLVNIIGHVITNKRFDNIVNNFTPVVDNKGIKFYGLFQIPYNRGETLFTKEPDMIEFIDEHITAGDIYYDIGANVGVFSLYAAIKKQAMVYSFEPESSNYFILNKNISLNNLTGQVTAYNLAINDKSEISVLNLIANIRPGKSGNNFNEELDEDLKQFTPQYKQGVFIDGNPDFLEHTNMSFINTLQRQTPSLKYNIKISIDYKNKRVNMKTIKPVKKDEEFYLNYPIPRSFENNSNQTTGIL